MNEQQPNNDKKAPADLTEGQYLTDQVNQASAAIGAAFAALKSDLAKGVDPKVLAKQHPWVVVGGAAVAGFFAANALIPSKEEQALKKLERIERALNPRHTDYAPPPTARDGAAPEKKSLTGRLFSELLSSLKPALSSALAAYAAGQSNNHDGDGQAPQSSAAAAGNAAYYQQDADTDQQA